MMVTGDGDQAPRNESEPSPDPSVGKKSRPLNRAFTRQWFVDLFNSTGGGGCCSLTLLLPVFPVLIVGWIVVQRNTGRGTSETPQVSAAGGRGRAPKRQSLTRAST